MIKKNIYLIGAGNVATHLGIALKSNNHNVAGVFSKTYKPAKALAAKIGAQHINNKKIFEDKEGIFIISVPDWALEDVINIMKNCKGLVIHTSGSVDMNSLSVFKNHGVFYPLQTFSKEKEINFEEIPICIEANNEENKMVLQKLAQSLSKHVHYVNSEKRMILHISAVFACNFTNFMYQLSEDLMHKNNLNFSILRPLIIETANKAIIKSPKEIQTGPAARGDMNTIRKHEEYLSNFPGLEKIYTFISQKIQQKKS